MPLKLLSVPVAAVFVTIVAESNAPAGEAIGYWFGAQLVPLLVGLIVVRFKPLRKIRTFSTLFCCVGLVGLLFVFFGSVQERLARHQKTVREIVKEAAGTKPIENTGDSSEQAMDRVSREFLSDILAARKKHDADATALQPVLATLYTPGSFQSRQHMENMIAAVRKIEQVDGEMAEKLQRWPQETRARLDASGLSQQQKEDYLSGFQKAYGSSDVMAAWREVHSIEGQWATATVDLYTFASQHARGIKTNSKQILIADKSVLSPFNARFTNSRDLRNKLHQANQRLATIQSLNMQKLGINKADLGLQK